MRYSKDDESDEAKKMKVTKQRSLNKNHQHWGRLIISRQCSIGEISRNNQSLNTQYNGISVGYTQECNKI